MSSIYWNGKTHEFVVVEEGDVAPDGSRKVPALFVLLIAPFFGLAFILFLPLAVPAVLAWWAIRWLKKVIWA